ncbi:MAG TPA: hypothetical protein VGS41_06565, partial [Chthonomonadales bacterium]|nr:hypothetical protein [Chthonomonadales bacterium]
SNQWDRLLLHPQSRTLQDLSNRTERLWRVLGAAGSEAPFEIEWLRASLRHTGLSYWYAKTRYVRLHGLLADSRIPGDVVDFEIGYWLARRRVGSRWQAISQVLECAGMGRTRDNAMKWRRYQWTRFRNRFHPLLDR